MSPWDHQPPLLLGLQPPLVLLEAGPAPGGYGMGGVLATVKLVYHRSLCSRSLWLPSSPLLDLAISLKASRWNSHSAPQCCSACILEAGRLRLNYSVTFFMLLFTILPCRSNQLCTPCGFGLVKLRQLSAATDFLPGLNIPGHTGISRSYSPRRPRRSPCRC